MSAVWLRIGIGAALADGASALASGIKAVTSARISSTPRVACAIVIDDAPKAVQTLAQLRERGAKTPFEFPEPADAGRKPIAFEERPQFFALSSGTGWPEGRILHPPLARPGQDQHCCDGTTCEPNGSALVMRAIRRCGSNWSRCGAVG